LSGTACSGLAGTLCSGTSGTITPESVAHFEPVYPRWQQGEKAYAHLNTFVFLPTQNAKTKKPKEFKS
jgi:hypothetical protein